MRLETHARLKDFLKACLVIEYLCVYPEPSVPLMLRPPPPPGSCSTVTCAMRKLKPRQISPKQEFSLLFFIIPQIPTAFKPQCVYMCDRSKSSPNSKSMQPPAQYPLHNSEKQPISTELSNDWTCCGILTA